MACDLLPKNSKRQDKTFSVSRDTGELNVCTDAQILGQWSMETRQSESLKIDSQELIAFCYDNESTTAVGDPR
jgi:hypothetical protein